MKNLFLVFVTEKLNVTISMSAPKIFSKLPDTRELVISYIKLQKCFAICQGTYRKLYVQRIV